MIENVVVGECYKFHLNDGSLREGKVDYIDEEVITIYNGELGESEIVKTDCYCVEPLISQ